MKNCGKNVNFPKGAGAKCDHLKLGVRTGVRAHLNLDVRGACVRPKKWSQLAPWAYIYYSTNRNESTGNDRQKLLLSQYYRGVYDGCAECALSDDLST